MVEFLLKLLVVERRFYRLKADKELFLSNVKSVLKLKKKNSSLSKLLFFIDPGIYDKFFFYDLVEMESVKVIG